MNNSPSRKRIVRSRLTILLFLICLGTICQAKKENVSSLLPPGGYTIENIVYKNTIQGAQKLDIYLPHSQTSANTPVVVFIHGGSWMHGNKEEITKKEWIRLMLKNMLHAGYAVVSIDYRLVNDSITVVYPAPLADCKDAVKWVKANALLYHFDSNRIAVMGTSAGAHLALMTAYAPDGIAPGNQSLQSYDSRVKCVVDIYGPTDMSKILRSRLSPIAVSMASLAFKQKVLDMRSILLWSFTGESGSHPGKRTEKCLLYSPMTYVRDAVPTIVFHGTKDTVVPFSHTAWLQQAMTAQGLPIEVHPIENEDHTFPTITASQSEAMAKSLILFLNSHL